jgi:hypothetical protein
MERMNLSETQQIVFGEIFSRMTAKFDHSTISEIILLKTKPSIIVIKNNLQTFELIIDNITNICKSPECYIMNHCWKDLSGPCCYPDVYKFIIDASSPEVANLESFSYWIMDKIINMEKYTCRGCGKLGVASGSYCDTCLYTCLTKEFCEKCSICHEYITIDTSTTTICGDIRHSIHKKCFLQLPDKHLCAICRQEWTRIPRRWSEVPLE